MVTALIHLPPEQKKRLASRARRRGTSFSQEVRDAVDLYLDIPVESEPEFAALAARARVATERMIQQLDDVLATVRRTRKRWKSLP